jgi:lysophospholipase L1-like esterase
MEALWAKLRTPRLPEAKGSPVEVTGAKFSILGIGESTVAGVGVEQLELALTARTAAALSVLMKQPVDWMSFGRNGARLQNILEDYHQLPTDSHDVIIVSIGVNDVTGLTSLVRWSHQLLELIRKLQLSYGAPVFFCAVPPMHLFTALPQPLRYALGVRARLLSQVIAQTAQAMENVYFVNPDIPREGRYLAEDGYHPSADGYQYLGEQLADCIYPAVKK